MNKQNIATTIVLILCACTFAIVGTSFMNYVYAKAKIEVEDSKIVAAQEIRVYDKDDDTKKQLEVLFLSDSELGLKPVTGDQDAETKIPSTVTNKNGSEGVYASFVVDASVNFRIVVKNIKIVSGGNKQKVEKERENLFVAIMDKTDGAKNLVSDQVEIASEQAANGKEFTFLFWLDSKASDELKGAKISFELHFVV